MFNQECIQEIEHNCEYVAKILKILAHPKRLMILCHLAQAEKSVGQVEDLTKISQSQVSQFLKKMQTEDLIKPRKEGNFVYYSIKDPKIQSLLNAMHSIFCKI